VEPVCFLEDTFKEWIGDIDNHVRYKDNGGKALQLIFSRVHKLG